MLIKAAQHLLGSLAMHQVEGDLGGGVNISANLVCFYLNFLILVGDFKTCVPLFGQEGFS
jgi:hypothetical protein